MKHNFLLILALCVLTGCYCPYDFVEPEMVPADALSFAIDQAANDSVVEKDAAIPEDWWLLYEDEQLTYLINKALLRNPTLQSAQSRISAALYESDKRFSALIPHITLSGDIQRNRLSKTGVFPDKVPASVPVASGVPSAPVVPSLIPFFFTLYEAAFNFNYDLDLWNKNRNMMRAALDEAQAKFADEAFTRLSLSVAVAQAYWQLQIDYQRKQIADRLVTNRAKFTDYVVDRIQHNIDTDTPRYSAQQNLTSAQQRLLEIEGTIAIHEHQLKALLADQFDESIVKLEITKQNIPRIPIPKELPLHLIAHRPDIMSQLWIISSAGRQIEVAKAGFYPDINLMGFYGQQTIHPERFFEWRSGFGIAESAFSLPIFDAGYLNANLLSTEVNYDLAILKYNQLILDAVKEILDGLTLLDNNYQQFILFTRESEDQAASFELTNLRQKHHLAAGLDQLNSEQTYLLARDHEIIALGNTLQASLQLIKALGGGYDACIENEVK